MAWLIRIVLVDWWLVAAIVAMVATVALDIYDPWLAAVIFAVV